jgi:dienelactone hydrolase
MAASVQIPLDGAALEADLTVPAGSRRLVIFAHGSGSSRHSPRNQAVARVFESYGLATLVADLLTSEEGHLDERGGRLRFDIPLLGRRVVALIDWARHSAPIDALSIELFGASTGAAAALVAAAARPDAVEAVVSRGGRPDLAGSALPVVRAPTLLIVGSRDSDVLDLNREAAARMRATVRLAIVPGATHLFEEPGALDQVADLAARWLTGDRGRVENPLAR